MNRWSHGDAHTVVFDVGSGSVAVAYIVSSTQGVRVHAASRVVLNQEEREKKQIEAGLKRCFQEAHAAVQKHISTHRIKTCVVMYHAPWTRTRTFVERAPLKAEMLIVPDLVTQLEKRALAAHQSDAATSVFERSVMQYEINGYPTHQPLGKKGASISVGVIESGLEQGLGTSIRDAVRAAYPEASLSEHSAMYVYSVVSQRVFPDWNRYTIVDMSSEATACLAIRDGLAQEYAAVPFGWRTFLRQLAEQLHAEADDVFMRLRLIARDACVDASCVQITSAVRQLVPILTKTFGDLFAQAAQTRRLPQRLIHVAPAPLVQWNELFERIDFAQFTEIGQPFDAHELQAQNLATHVQFGSGVDSDSSIAIIADFVHRGDVYKRLS